jgi:hypothetical protein
MDYRRSYRSAAVAYVDLVSRLPADRWDGPGLGEWTLRDLVGHTASSALRQVPEALSAPADEVVIGTAEGYFALARSVPQAVLGAARAASTADARETGRTLGDNPAPTIGALAGAATQALAAVGDDDIVTTPAGGMRVRDWLPTRTFELIVHGIDAALAAEVPHGFAEESVAVAAVLAARTAVAVGDAEPLLRALTGRGDLPRGFSVV